MDVEVCIRRPWDKTLMDSQKFDVSSTNCRVVQFPGVKAHDGGLLKKTARVVLLVGEERRGVVFNCGNQAEFVVCAALWWELVKREGETAQWIVRDCNMVWGVELGGK